jgi:hypothetical protein
MILSLLFLIINFLFKLKREVTRMESFRLDIFRQIMQNLNIQLRDY